MLLCVHTAHAYARGALPLRSPQGFAARTVIGCLHAAHDRSLPAVCSCTVLYAHTGRCSATFVATVRCRAGFVCASRCRNMRFLLPANTPLYRCVVLRCCGFCLFFVHCALLVVDVQAVYAAFLPLPSPVTLFCHAPLYRACARRGYRHCMTVLLPSRCNLRLRRTAVCVLCGRTRWFHLPHAVYQRLLRRVVRHAAFLAWLHRAVLTVDNTPSVHLVYAAAALA